MVKLYSVFYLCVNYNHVETFKNKKDAINLMNKLINKYDKVMIEKENYD